MSIQSLSETATRKAEAVLSVSISEEERRALAKVIEGVVIEAIKITSQQCKDAAAACCENSPSMSKKIVIEINKTPTVKMADMGSMR